MEASWDTDDQSGSPVPESSSLDTGIYRPEDDNIANVSYEEFETPVKCQVLYNYTVYKLLKFCIERSLFTISNILRTYTLQAQNPDELTIVASEELQILGEGDGDGWLRARNSAGQEGFVPCTYLDTFSGDEEQMMMEHDEDGMPMGSGSHLTSQISFSSVDYTVNASGATQGVYGGDSDVISGDSSASIVTTVHELGTVLERKCAKNILSLLQNRVNLNITVI